MAVDANTEITYTDKTIREDLSDAENLLDVWETPFLSLIAKRGKATNVKHEWPKLSLQAANLTNRQIEGNDGLVANVPNYANRRANYTQISTKLVSVSDTSQWVDGAANIEKISKQISYKLKELKIDKESMLLDNIAANPGAAGTARAAAGLAAFWITNTSFGASPGANPILSGTTDGYPTTARVNGVSRALTEALFRTVMQACWTSGGQPKYALVGPSIKSKISETFTGIATRYKDADDKKITVAIDIYESDFGTVQIVPDRYVRAIDIHFIDPDYVSVDYGQDTSQKEIARTGLSEKRLISCEYTLMVANEASGGLLTDVT